ncbi:MAG: hypothetical protein ACYSTG_02910 [Planctomycetota bacterium]
MTNKSKRPHAKTIADNAEDACVYGDKGKVTAKYEGGNFVVGCEQNLQQAVYIYTPLSPHLLSRERRHR